MPLGMHKYNRGLHTGNWEVEEKAGALVTKLLDNNSIFQELLNIETFSALFCKRNETFLEAMRWSFRKKLVELCNELNASTDTETEKNAKLNRYICNLPLASIKTGQKYLIPTYNAATSRWQLVTYKVVPIELTPTYGLGRLALVDNDRFFAYGFTPVDNEDVNPPPRLVFVSPEYPAQQGFLANLYLKFQYISGFYQSCQRQIDHWLKESVSATQTKATIHAIGQASRLALAATRLSSEEYIAQEYKLPCPLEDGSLNDSVFKGYFGSLVVNSLLGCLVNTLLVMPCQYFFIPVIRAILNHKTELALLSILTMVYIMLPGLVMTEIGAILAIFTAVYFGCKLIEPIKVLCNTHEKTEATCHIPHHKEEQDDEEYRVNLIASLSS